jgi:hypothetical protein
MCSSDLLPSLKIETSRSSKSLAPIYQITRNSILQDCNVNIYCRENMIKAGDIDFMCWCYILCFYITYFKIEHYSPEQYSYTVTVHKDSREFCVVSNGCNSSLIKLYKMPTCTINRYRWKKFQLQKRNKTGRVATQTPGSLAVGFGSQSGHVPTFRI